MKDSPNIVKGIRTYSRESFETLFAPAFPLLRGLHWLTLPDAFRVPTEWIDASEFDAEGEVCLSGPVKRFLETVQFVREGAKTYGCHVAGDAFPELAAAVGDDWTSIFGVPAPVTDPRAWLAAYYDAKDRAAYLTANAHVVFLSVDSAFWEIFAEDQAVLDVVEASFRARAIEHEPMELRGNAGYL